MPSPDPPPVARGSPLIRSEADLDALAAIAPADVAAARRYWRRKAPARFKGLLDAQEKSDAAKNRVLPGLDGEKLPPSDQR